MQLATSEDLAAEYDDAVGRRACMFADVTSMRSRKALARTVQTLVVGMHERVPDGRVLPVGVTGTLTRELIATAVGAGAKCLSIGTRPRKPSSATAISDSLRRFFPGNDANRRVGLVFYGMSPDLTVLDWFLERVAIAGCMANPNAWAPPSEVSRSFVLHHEGKHLEQTLAPGLRKSRRLPTLPMSRHRANVEEVECDVHAASMTKARTGMDVSAHMADVRAAAFAVAAFGGEPCLEHWTTWALDAGISYVAVSASAAGDVLDRECAPFGIREREMTRVENAFRLASASNPGDLNAFLKAAAEVPSAKRYAERCMLACQRMLDVPYMDAFRGNAFSLASQGDRWMLSVSGRDLLCMGVNRLEAEAVKTAFEESRIRAWVGFAERCDELDLPDGLAIDPFDAWTTSFVRNLMGDASCRAAFLMAAARADRVISGSVPDGGNDDRCTPPVRDLKPMGSPVDASKRFDGVPEIYLP